MKDYGYTYIVKWGRELGSMPYYIAEQCEQAHRDKAPLNAIYKNSEGRWETTDDLANNGIRVRMGLDPLPPAHPVTLRVYDGTVIPGTEPPAKIRFPSLMAAARWASDKNLGSRVMLIAPNGQGFSEPATVLLYPAREEAAS
jgi:hypothetical protein